MERTYTEEELFEGFRRGDQEATEQIFNLHYGALCYFADRLVQDKAEAEDIVSDAFIKLLQLKETIYSFHSIKGFLYTTTRHFCLNILHRNKVRAKDHVVLAQLTDAHEQASDRESVIAKVLQVIHAEIENLPPVGKQVFTSIFIDGKSTAEIAAELGISPQTVLNHKTKMLNILRNKLYREGYNDNGLFAYCLTLLAVSTHA
jgi:RNA polymerase sigma-70 factor (family 1)